MTNSIRRGCAQLIALACLFVSGPIASAITLDVGGTGTSDCTFWCVDRVQQVYDASLFPGNVVIDRVSFFASPLNGIDWNNVSTWEMTLSTSVNPVGALSATFADNVGADVAVFDTVTFFGTPVTNSLVSFLGSFNYDPSLGDLLIDIQRVSGLAYGTGLDAGYSPGNIDRAYAFVGTVTAGGVNQGGYAVRTQFGMNVPEPSSLGMLLAAGALLFASHRAGG